MSHLRRAADRGHARLGWLDSRHTFSFGDYYDPAHLGFGPLRVVNEDRVRPGQGFGTHGHRDMEIVTYVVSGALEHRDSLGNGSVIRPGDVQRMSAGTGIRHSEYNHSGAEDVHFLQIWIEPAAAGLSPGYEQRHFAEEELRGVLRRVASATGADGAVTLHQDVELFAARLGPGDTVRHVAAPARRVWLQLIDGELAAGGTLLAAGDGLGLTDPGAVTLRAMADAHLLLFDLPG